MKCPHNKFISNVDVSKSQDGRFLATVRIRCAVCHENFQFLGIAPGIDLNGASVSSDLIEARLAVGTPDTLSDYYLRATQVKVDLRTNGKIPEIKKKNAIASR